MTERDQYLLRCLVTAQRERKMAHGTKDAGLIKAAETRLSVAWKNATDHVDATTRATVLAGNAGVPGTSSGLSDFIRNATPEAKAEVYRRVMDKVAAQQQAVIDAAAGVTVVGSSGSDWVAVGGFRFNSAWSTWEQVAAEYADDPDVTTLYRKRNAGVKEVDRG